MRKFWCLSIAALSLLALVSLCQAQAVTLNAAGATFPYPVYSQWAHKYNELTGVKLNYQSIGSGGGIAQIKAHTVDFGASDAPLKPEELEAIGVVQFPTVMGGVLPILQRSRRSNPVSSSWRAPPWRTSTWARLPSGMIRPFKSSIPT